MKIGPYNPVVKNKLSKFNNIKLLLSGKNDPGLDMDMVKKIPIDKQRSEADFIISSTAKRAKETIKNISFNKNPKIIYSTLLQEIKFSPTITEKEYNKNLSTAIRKNFIELFISDDLNEKRHELLARIKKLDKKLSELKSKHPNILCVSHTFFLKLFLIYKKNPEIFTTPENIKNYIHPQKRIMDFYESFTI